MVSSGVVEVDGVVGGGGGILGTGQGTAQTRTDTATGSCTSSEGAEVQTGSHDPMRPAFGAARAARDEGGLVGAGNYRSVHVAVRHRRVIGVPHEEGMAGGDGALTGGHRRHGGGGCGARVGAASRIGGRVVVGGEAGDATSAVLQQRIHHQTRHVSAAGLETCHVQQRQTISIVIRTITFHNVIYSKDSSYQFNHAQLTFVETV